ncbi:Nuclear receptor domain-containing protein [Caenorhabditis elegans]|uniref:Nuclear receptor domain-containing protein n=1 Tax=Caenorhabditis elegans TaxID=6239 RepID=Q9XVK1_CAEEL|nr:Nuclear receptor domain-containing protein [Caenorhabditis elegans]CAB03244.2 Nuclear receptor domain-containing protein [Caenorhabditis elegans]|eukprot:NP_506457.2 Dauer Pheromone Responsive [Caenorhabditis elegans]
MDQSNSDQTNEVARTCLVCTITENVRFHFGSTTCLACASFFRRTVSLKIQYVCKQSNNCIVSHAVRSGCRSCRFQNCLKSGMKTNMVRGKRDINKVPKYIRESMQQGDNMTVRNYTTSTLETLHGFPKQEELELPVVKEDAPNLLIVSPDQLLDYYLDLNEKEPLPLSKIHLNTLGQLNQQNHVESEFICKNCPGTDLISTEDKMILIQYVKFANLWLDALWDELHAKDKQDKQNLVHCGEFADYDRLFSTFISNLYESVGQFLCNLNLDIVEYSALKSFVIWKLGVVDFSITLKIVAQEHYLGVSAALIEYYKTEKNMEEMEIAVRFADLTLLLGPIFNSYKEMVNLYEEIRTFV